VQERASQTEDQRAYCAVDEHRYGPRPQPPTGNPLVKRRWAAGQQAAAPCVNRLFVLEGYWQAWRYFAPHADESVRAAFRVSDRSRRAAEHTMRLARAAKDPENTSVVVSVQVRLGDKVGHTLYQQTGSGYYRAAMRLASLRLAAEGARSVLFLVTSDDPKAAHALLLPQNSASGAGGASTRDGDVRVSVFASEQPATGKGPYVDFAILAACDALIIGPSSLGWWGAYLSTSARFVISPKELFAHATPLHAGFSRRDYFPPHWTLLANDGSVIGSETDQ